MMKFYQYPDEGTLSTILKRPVMERDMLLDNVRQILESVRSEGDQALIRYASKLDQAQIKSVTVSAEELSAAAKQVPQELKNAIGVAAKNIHAFHSTQKLSEPHTETMPGVLCWRETRPITKVGIYIPGGTAPLFSSVLMLAIPAIIAGCQEIVLCTPPQRNGSIPPVIAYCAELCGVHRVIRAGGAQAIAALAYGTESVPMVDKIFGPGNQYVTLAKQLVSMEGIAIDMPAGPSEVAIIADDSANPSFVAIDLLSQAEHGKDSQVILMATDKTLIDKTIAELERLSSQLSRKIYIEESLKNSTGILVESLDEAVSISNTYAPEHLILAVENPELLVKKVQHAGSVFLGHYTPEAAGDYASGTNHTLPTNGHARAYSGVSVDSYMRRITFQSITREGLKNLGPTVELMAAAENLDAHKMAVTLRLRHEE